MVVEGVGVSSHVALHGDFSEKGRMDSLGVFLQSDWHNTEDVSVVT